MSFDVTPGLIDWILLGIVTELTVLAVWLQRRSATRWIWPVALYLGSGAALMVALRAALSDAAAHWIALALLLGGVAHVASLLATLRIASDPRP